MKKYTYLVTLLIAATLFYFYSCGTTNKSAQTKFEKEVGNAYFDSYYLFMKDSTLRSIQQLKKNFEVSQSPEIAFLIARMYFQGNHIDSSEAYFARACQLDSTNTDYLNLYFEILQKTMQNPKKSLALAHRLINIDSTSAENQHKLIISYIFNNQYDSAILHCKKFRNSLLSYINVDQLLCNLYMQTQQPDSALALLPTLIENNPTSDDNYFFASTIAAHCEDTLRFKQFFQKGLRYGCPDPQHVEAFAQYMLESRQKEGLIASLDTIMNRCTYPTPWIISMLRDLHVLFNKKPIENSNASHLFARFEELLDSSNDGQYLLLQYYNLYNDTTKILNCVEKNSKQFAPNYIWDALKINYGFHYKTAPTLTNWNEETESLRENIYNYPFDLFPTFVYLEYTRNVVDSIQHLDSIDRYIDIYQQMLQKSKKGSVYRFPLTFDQDTTLKQNLVLRNNLSRLYGYKGDMSQNKTISFDAYNKALKYNKNNEIVLNNYAYNLALSEEKELGKALKMAERSVEIDPNNVNYLDTYGYILYRLKRYKEAKAVFVKLLSIDPNPGKVSLLHYCDILEALGNKDAAQIYRMKAAKE